MATNQPEPGDTAAPLVLGLRDPAAGEPALTGGKAANLSSLIGAGFRVPDGFVVTTRAYAEALERGGLGPRIATHLDSGEGAAGRIADEFAGLELPGAVREAVDAAYARLGSPAVAVRSSATDEDLPGASFAGQQETYLNVAGPAALHRAVRDCWASLYSERAIDYRRERGITAEVGIAVVVQKMVEPEHAGVLFTADVVTGARDRTIVESSPGLGEAVVSGLVTPDHHVLDADGRILVSRPGRREVVVRSAPGGGTTTEAAGGAAAPDRADGLGAETLAGLAALGARAQEHFGRPQDMEWALAGGRLHVLQSRPLTALPPAPVKLSRVQRIAGPVIAELIPERPYPMDMSAWVGPGVGTMVSRMLREIPGLEVDLVEELPEVGGVVDRFVPPRPRPTRALLTAPYRLQAKIRRNDPARWRDDARCAAFEAGLAAELDRPAGGLAWAELVRRPGRAVEIGDLITDLRVDYLPRAGLDLLRLRAALVLVGRGRLFADLLTGARTRTGDANAAVARLAALVRAEPELARRAGAGELTGDALAGFPGVARAFAALLDEYGHRETRSILYLSAPTWADSPETVLGAVAGLACAGPTGAPGGTPGVASDAERRLDASPLLRRSPRLAAALHRRVDAARAGVALREDTHFDYTRVLPLARGAVQEMGRRLAEAGVVERADDVWHLRLEEIEPLPEPEAAGAADRARLRELVAQRRQRRVELEGAPLIAASTLFPKRRAAADALVAGAPVGGGRRTGTVRIVRHAGEFSKLRPGEILVCPGTNPAWTPLFAFAAAVVVDTGGPGSHAAIVAREYGIPAVMGTGDATAVLHDGDRVTVDGDRGTVETATGGDPGRG
ncbi:PEP/pyruvate-binding domain-containing protein [Zhihengliuella salsuginis]|uniref:Pyruvate, water dikinase n=1 Tax=Zhihengliuella salsuginis TaxID=578222 RepID=A0ABQ3GIE9_9MICC|nr:PEP/pyruvate-binding domain-containing protein [Zhihengliuella salsuginis]GHD06451.1 hypothetical protein GCM10008096_16460 [Zhihengliuella salsuginis]